MPRQTDTPFEQRTDSCLFTLANKGYTGRAVLIVTGAVFALGVLVGARIW